MEGTRVSEVGSVLLIGMIETFLVEVLTLLCTLQVSVASRMVLSSYLKLKIGRISYGHP